MFFCPCQNPTPSYSAQQDAKSLVLPSVLSAARGEAANQTNESAGPRALVPGSGPSSQPADPRPAARGSRLAPRGSGFAPSHCGHRG